MQINDYQQYRNALSPIEKKHAPTQLLYRGDFSLLTNYVKVAVVGSRKVSDQGKLNTKFISEVLSKLGYVVVSGLAEGVDTIAHTVAMQSGGKTIAVLGTPLNKVTPKSNESIYNEICANHLAVSQFSENEVVLKSFFPQRNRTMALLSDATIIVEATEISGTRHQAWEALRLGRPLFLIDELFNKPDLNWPNKMLDYGAIRIKLSDLKSTLSDVSQLTLHHEFPLQA